METYRETADSLAAYYASLDDPDTSCQVAASTADASAAIAAEMADVLVADRTDHRPSRSPSLSGDIFRDAVHRMLQHIAFADEYVSTGWHTLLRILVSQNGNGSY
ncbi:hypothetical protein AAVH_23287 [Aphelenchoides avenae]|nr:hypothetical protein AAVH_23287 [Aphelenchus avenae]